MHSYSQPDGNPEPQNPRTTKEASGHWIALRLDFVARPEASGELGTSIAGLLDRARLEPAGMVSSVLLVSDREARLATLLTFWDPQRFLPARERRTAWMEKLVAPFADGAVRAQTSVASFLAAAPETAVPAGLLGSLPLGVAFLAAR